LFLNLIKFIQERVISLLVIYLIKVKRGENKMHKKVLMLIFLILLIFLSTSSTMAEQITLKFMGWEASPLETNSIKTGLNEFMTANPDIKVEYTPVPFDEFHSKLLTMMAGNSAPDVFFLASAFYRDFAARNVLVDLTDKVDSQIGIDNFIPSSQTKMLVNNKIYGVSSCTVSPVLFYNKNLFDKANLSYPPADPAKMWNWDKFVDVAKKLTIKSGKRTQQFGVFGFQNFWWTTVLSNGASVFTDDYSKITLQEPAAQEALQKIVDLRKKDGVAPAGNFLENSGMNTAQMLQTGKVAMVVDGSWALQELAKMDFPIGVAPLPKLKDTITTGQAHLHAIWKGSKHKEAAWKLVKFLSSSKYQTNLVKVGLWMPNRKAMYTPEGIKKWYNPKVHPANFKALTDYFLNAKLEPSVIAPQEAWDVLTTEELEKIWYANQPVKEVTESMQDRINNLLNQ
jgi:multiple sugar transport system substrate-binding protein